MQNRFSSIAAYSLFILGIMALIILGWVNYQVSSRYPIGGQFLIDWASTRALITTGSSPYQQTIEKFNQIPSVNNTILKGTQSRFISPLYAGLVYLPFASIPDYILARAIWMTFLEVLLVILVIACQRINRWRPKPVIFVVYFLFGLLWIHSIDPIIQGSDVIILALLIPITLSALRAGLDELAGFLLAFSTIEPLMILLLVVFVLLWAVFHRRWKVIVWFFGSLLLLVVISLFIYPGWLIEYIRALNYLLQQDYLTTPGSVFSSWWPGIGSKIGWILTLIMSLVLCLEWWSAAKRKDTDGLFWTACLTLTIGQLIGIKTSPTYFIILLIPMVLIFSTLEKRWNQQGRIMIILIAIIFGIVPWLLFSGNVIHGLSLNQYPALLFPLPVFMVVTLYWVRWWAIRAPKLYVDSLKELEKA